MTDGYDDDGYDDDGYDSDGYDNDGYDDDGHDSAGKAYQEKHRSERRLEMNSGLTQPTRPVQQHGSHQPVPPYALLLHWPPAPCAPSSWPHPIEKHHVQG